MSSSNSSGIALLFAKIEDSYRLSSRLGTLYNSVLIKHHEIIKSLLMAYQNDVIELAEDTSFISFKNPEQAIRAAIAFQQFISHHIWPNQEMVRLCIGIHWSATSVEGLEFTSDVEIVMGVCSASHGEQILLSQVLVDKLKGKQINDLNIHPLGEFHINDHHKSIKISQLDVPGLKVNFSLIKAKSASPSIAVLPFHNLNKDSRDDYLGLGIAEEIISSLDKNSGVQVLARATTFGVNPMLKIKDLGRLLNASVVLDGTVKKENENIYITVELTDINSGLDLWVESYEGPESDLMAIQDSITSCVTKKIAPGKKQVISRIIQDSQTENVEAYDAYLRGNKFYYQYSLQSIQFARRMYQRAMQVDRSYTLAYCGLANCFSYLFMHHSRSEENLTSADKFSRKAIELNPELAAAYSAYGTALSLRENYEESELAFEKAVSLDPMLFEAQYQYGRMAFNRGDLIKASSQFELASRIRHDDYQSLLLNGQCYDTLGEIEKAAETRTRGVNIAEEVLQLNPGDVRALYMGANGLVALGGDDNREKGLTWLQRALALDPRDSMLLYNAGCIYALCDMRNEAINCLEHAVTAGLTQKAWYMHDSNLDSLRDDDRFEKLLNSL